MNGDEKIVGRQRDGDGQAPQPDALRVSADRDPPAGWDRFVRTTAGGTFCHLSGWRQIMGDVLGHESHHLTARAGDGPIEGLLPLVTVKSRLFGHYMVSMPFLNYGGPLGTSAARDALALRAREMAREAGADLLELRWRAGAAAGDAREKSGVEAEESGVAGAAAGDAGTQERAPDEVPEGAPDEAPEEAPEAPEGFTVTGRKVTVLLPLPDDPEVLWKDGLRAKVRSQVRRPMKEGLEARFGPGEIDSFYRVFCRNMRDLGTPVLPRTLFERLPEVFGDDVVFASIYKDDLPVAVGCGFRFRGEFELTWASSLQEFNRLAPNMLLYWRLMEHAIEQGCTVFNFGRCTPGGGTHRFKKQWGGEDEPLPWVVWSPTGEVATPNPDQGKYRLATAAWSRLPVPLTRMLGPVISRRIP